VPVLLGVVPGDLLGVLLGVLAFMFRSPPARRRENAQES